jgi:multiple sugar transport system substrate-binding protein
MTGLISATLLSACGQPAPSAPAKPAEPAAPAKPAEKAAPVAAQPASQPAATKAAGQATFWFNQPTQMDAFQKIIERFHQAQTRTKLEVVLVPAGEIAAKLATSIAGGSPPDAVRLGGAAINALFINNKHAAALDDFDPKIGAYDWLKGSKEIVTRDGKMFAMPVNSGVQVLVYNKDLYQKAGLDPEKPATTFDEMVEHSAKISASGEGRFGYYMESAPTSVTGGESFPSVLWAHGGDVISADGKSVIVNSPEGVAALTWYTRLVQAKGMPVKQLGGPQVLNDFLTGNVGGILSFPGNVARIAASGFKTASTAPPKGPKPSQPQLGTGTIMVFDKAKNKEGGWEFAKFIGLDAANMAAWNIGFGQLPPRDSVRTDSSWKEFETKNHLVPAYMEAQKNARVLYYGPGSQEIFTELGKAVEAVVFGQKSPAQAMEEAQKASQVILERELKKG